MAISIRVAEDTVSRSKGITGGPVINSVVKKFETHKLKEEIRELSISINELFSNLSSVGDYDLDTIDVGLEISSEGGVNLIGSIKVGTKASIQLSYKKRPEGEN